MKKVIVIFYDDDVRCTVIQPNGKEKDFIQVSAMLNWCAENNYEPTLKEETISNQPKQMGQAAQTSHKTAQISH